MLDILIELTTLARLGRTKARWKTEHWLDVVLWYRNFDERLETYRSFSHSENRGANMETSRRLQKFW